MAEEAFNAAFADYKDKQKKRAEQESEREAWESEQAQKKAEAEEAEQEFVPETKEWEEINWSRVADVAEFKRSKLSIFAKEI